MNELNFTKKIVISNVVLILLFFNAFYASSQGVHLTGACDSLIVCNPNDTACFSNVEDSPDYFDSCSSVSLIYQLDLFSDGFNDESGTGGIEGNYPYGMHEILWIVEDSCGIDSCIQALEIQDCVAPDLPTCFPGIITMIGEENEPWSLDARDFLQDDIDNCYLGDENISWSLDTLIHLLDFCCPGSQSLTYFISDEFGNYDSCNLNIDFDYGGLDSCFLALGGVVQRPLNQGLEDVRVSMLDFLNNELNFDNTESDGFYGMLNRNELNTIKLLAHRDDDADVGVSVYDAVLIQKHLLGISSLNAFQLVAADVNGNCAITAIDMVTIRRILLGVDDEWPNNTPVWKFWDQKLDSSVFVCQQPNPIVVGHTTDTVINWWAVKTGDVSGAFMDSLFQQQSEDRSVKCLNYSKCAIDKHLYNFSLDTRDIVATQFSLNLSSVSINSIECENPNFHFNILDDELRIIWTNVAKREIDHLDFSVQLDYASSTWTPSLNDAFDSVIYSAKTKSQIEVKEHPAPKNFLSKKPNIFPNPLSKDEVLNINTTEMNRIELYDVRGKLLLIAENLTELNLADFSIHPGVYTLKIIENQSENRVHQLVIK